MGLLVHTGLCSKNRSFNKSRGAKQHLESALFLLLLQMSNTSSLDRSCKTLHFIFGQPNKGDSLAKGRKPPAAAELYTSV